MEHVVNGGGDEDITVEATTAPTPVVGAGPVSVPSSAPATPSVPTKLSLTEGNGATSRLQPEAVLDSPALMAGKRNRKISHKYVEEENAQVCLSLGCSVLASTLCILLFVRIFTSARACLERGLYVISNPKCIKAMRIQWWVNIDFFSKIGVEDSALQTATLRTHS